MIPALDETHDPKATSWLESANDGKTDFPIQNLAYGVFRRPGGRGRIGVAMGTSILDLFSCAESNNILTGLDAATLLACRSDSLNELMSLNRQQRIALRQQLFSVLHTSATVGVREAVEKALVARSEVELQVPARIGDFTDFYASLFHATNVGSLFRPGNPLLPNYKWVPIAYHGRASSIVVSGTAIRRPQGQTMSEGRARPAFGPSRKLDYELEVGMYVSAENPLGTTVPIGKAEDHVFGLCLVNDWSARDIQSWEYQPLGPFLSKSFATTVSPWVVTLEALAPFRVPAFSRPPEDPAPLAYLNDEADRQHGAVDLCLEVSLTTRQMRAERLSPYRLSRASFREMYWTLAQLVTHHSSNGCNLRPGDLLASGTVSGHTPESRGCLLELTGNGKDKIQLPNGEERSFLEDDDEITLRGWCERPSAARIGFGECSGRILPSFD